MAETKPCFIAAALLFAGLSLSPAPVRADAIDGDWCREGRHLAISGPDIVTPGGTRMQGEYDRHGFAYVVPSGESGAGQSVRMVLIDDDIVTFRQGAEEPETWTRCRAPTS